MSLVDLARLPGHVAIIMDGNGRWATAQNQPRSVGHAHGAQQVRTIVRAARQLGLPALTLFAFSAQNWLRPNVEIDGLMDLLVEYLRSQRDELRERGIRLRAIGRLHKLPVRVRSVLEQVIADTQEGKDMLLTLALSYGGQEEIADAARELARRVLAGQITPEAIDVDLLQRSLPSCAPGPVDLLIRTGDEERISNFVLWGAAYAELYFTKLFWPDFSTEELHRALAAYQARDRRFGRIAANADVLTDTQSQTQT